MKHYTQHSHQFTPQELDSKVVVTGDGLFGIARATDRYNLELVSPFFPESQGSGWSAETLEYTDIVVMSLDEFRALFAPAIEAIQKKEAIHI